MRYFDLKIFAAIILLGPAAMAQSSQDLLDRLSQSDSAVVSTRLIDQIWQRWIGQAGNADQNRLMQQGLREMNLAQYRQAERTFDNLIALNPSYMEAWNKRATVRFLLGDLNGSQEDINEVLMREPRHFGALSGLGLINLQRGDLENAIRAYEKVLSIDPFSPNALTFLPKLRTALDRSEL